MQTGQGLCSGTFVVYLYNHYLQISVDDVARVEVFCGLEQLIHDVAFVHILQNVAPFDHIMQVCL